MIVSYIKYIFLMPRGPKTPHFLIAGPSVKDLQQSYFLARFLLRPPPSWLILPDGPRGESRVQTPGLKGGLPSARIKSMEKRHFTFAAAAAALVMGAGLLWS